MAIFDLDYSILNNIGKKTYKLADVQDKIVRVAFDVVRFSDGPVDELWEIQECSDGEYIVARYNSDEDSPSVKEASTPWEAIVKKGSSEVNLFYKGAAITKFAHDDAETIKNFLPNKLSTDRHFVQALFASLSSERQKEIKTLYPELF